MASLLKSTGEAYNIGDVLSIGSNAACDVILRASSIEARHALIEIVEEDRYILRDLHTQSGTYINNTRMRRDGTVPVQHGDVIRFGREPEEFKFSQQEARPRLSSFTNMASAPQSLGNTPRLSLPQMHNTWTIPPRDISTRSTPVSFAAIRSSSAVLPGNDTHISRYASELPRMHVVQSNPSINIPRTRFEHPVPPPPQPRAFQSSTPQIIRASQVVTEAPPLRYIQEPVMDSSVRVIDQELEHLLQHKQDSIRKDSIIAQLQREMQLLAENNALLNSNFMDVSARQQQGEQHISDIEYQNSIYRQTVSDLEERVALMQVHLETKQTELQHLQSSALEEQARIKEQCARDLSSIRSELQTSLATALHDRELLATCKSDFEKLEHEYESFRQVSAEAKRSFDEQIQKLSLQLTEAEQSKSTLEAQHSLKESQYLSSNEEISALKKELAALQPVIITLLGVDEGTPSKDLMVLLQDRFSSHDSMIQDLRAESISLKNQLAEALEARNIAANPHAKIEEYFGQFTSDFEDSSAIEKLCAFDTALHTDFSDFSDWERSICEIGAAAMNALIQVAKSASSDTEQTLHSHISQLNTELELLREQARLGREEVQVQNRATRLLEAIKKMLETKSVDDVASLIEDEIALLKSIEALVQHRCETSQPSNLLSFETARLSESLAQCQLDLSAAKVTIADLQMSSEIQEKRMAAQRKTHLDELEALQLKISDLEQQGSSVADLREQLAHANETQATLSTTILELTGANEKLRSDIDKAMQEQSVKNATIEDFKARLGLLEAEKDGILTKYQELLVQALESAKKVDGLKSQLQQAEVIASQNEQEIKSLQTQNFMKDSSIGDLQGDLKALLNSSEKRIFELEKDLKELEDRQHAIVQDGKKKDDVIRSLQQRIAEGEDQKALRDRERLIAQLKKECQELAARLTDVKGELSDSLKEQLNKLNDQLQATVAERDQARLNERNHRQETSVILSSQKEKIRLQAVTIEQLTEQLEKLNGQESAIKKIVAELDATVEERNALLSKLDDLEKKIHGEQERAAQEVEVHKETARRMTVQFESIVNDHQSQLQQLQDRVISDGKLFQDLRALLLEKEAALKRLNDQIGSESAVVSLFNRTLETAINVHATGLESLGEALGIKLAPLPINLLKTVTEHNSAILYQDWTQACRESENKIIRSFQELNTKLSEHPKEALRIEEAAKREKQSIVAQFELRLEQLNAKLARKDDMLRTYDSDLALLAEFKKKFAESEGKGVELQRHVDSLKLKLSEQRTMIQKLTDELDEQKQLCDALVKRKDFSMEHVVREKIEKEQKSMHGHDCVQVQQLQHDYEQQKASWQQKLRQKTVLVETLRRDLHTASQKLLTQELHVPDMDLSQLMASQNVS